LLRFSQSKFFKSAFSRYAIAVVAAFAALGLRLLLAPLLGIGNPYHTVWLGVVFCAWFCGVGPSILATLVMLLGVWYWFIPPYGSFHALDLGEFAGVAGFLLFAAIIITIGERARRTQARLNAAHAEMEGAVKQRTAELAEANERLRDLTGSLLHLQDVERRRFARELHDSVGQLLAVINMNLSAFENEKLSPEAARLLNDTKQTVEQIIREIRTISHLLHPPLLDEAGLEAALRIYVEGFGERSGIAADLRVEEDLPRLSPDLEISIFRIAQECLTNIMKHAAAKSVVIRIARSKGVISVSISDDGRGMGDGRNPGVGLRGMQERVRELRGTLRVDSSGRGTTITASMPLPESVSKADMTQARADLA
jgi:signal transduction histidine kinase